MTINYDVTKRSNLGKRASFDWLKVMSFILKAQITRINANLEVPLLGGLINFWRLSRFALITLVLDDRDAVNQSVFSRSPQTCASRLQTVY